MNLDEFEGHTPGPWILQDLYDNLAYFACRVGADRETYGHLWRVKHLPMKQYEGTCYFTNEADAKLIAAAPDLLAEVKRLRNTLRTVSLDIRPQDMGDSVEWYQKLREEYGGEVE